MVYIVLLKGISIEAKKIEVVKDWPEPKLICDIQVFLGFTNFYWQFIQNFSRIAALFTSILKTTRLSEPVSDKNNGNKSASSKNNDSIPTFEKNNINNKVDRFGISENDVENAKKLRKSKSEKTSKSRNLAKFKKKVL